MLRQCPSRGHAHRDQPACVGATHAGNQRQVVVSFPLALTFGLPRTRPARIDQPRIGRAFGIQEGFIGFGINAAGFLNR